MIEELRRFVLVAKNGNLTRTSEQVFITQSALSQSIQRLEKELKTKLFIRKDKTLYLTREGAAVVEIGTKILELWDKAKNPILRTTQIPIFTLGLFDSAAIQLGKFITNNTEKKSFNIEFLIGGSSKLLSQLQFGILDIAICVVDKKIPQPNGLILVKTFSEELIPVSSKIFEETIQKIPFILYNLESHTRSQIDDVFKNNNIVPHVFTQSTSVTFMKKLALLGSGIALLPKTYVENDLKQRLLKKQKLPIQFKREFGIYIQKNGKIQKDDQIIKDLIKNLN